MSLSIQLRCRSCGDTSWMGELGQIQLPLKTGQFFNRHVLWRCITGVLLARLDLDGTFVRKCRRPHLAHSLGRRMLGSVNAVSPTSGLWLESEIIADSEGLSHVA